MKKDKLREILNAKVLVNGDQDPDTRFDAVCGSDLMSELLTMMNDSGKNPGGVLLLTNLSNPQVVRTSEMVDIKLVVFLRGKKPDPETMEIARRCGISLMSTPFTMFRSCWLLHESGMEDLSADREPA